MNDGSSRTSPTPGRSPGIDTSVPHSARVWNYWLGGKENYPIDRQVAETMMPDSPYLARAYRHFLARVVRHLVGEAGIRQLLDVGTGLPTVDNTHEVAQRVAPEARIVYVDNDPLVLAHARALLTSTPEGRTDYIDADLRDPDAILRQAARTLDLSQPVALMLIGVLAHVADLDEAYAAVRRLLRALPPGSHLALLDGVDSFGEKENESMRRYNDSGAAPYVLRRKEQIAGFFDGLDLLEPGLVWCTRWRPEPSPFGPSPDVNGYGGVARKPAAA